MKPEREQEGKLREMIARMPDDVAKVVRAACKRHGLLPGGGKEHHEQTPPVDPTDPTSGSVPNG